MNKTKKAFINAKVFTCNEENPYAEAFIVEGDTITWIGNSNELTDSGLEVIDLKGKRVLPGFVDAHLHAIMLADFSKKISCLPPKINSLSELIDEIKRVRKEQGEGQWIEGWGYDEGKLKEHRAPTRYDLDKGAKDVPVCIIRTCGHIRCVNSKVLEMAGIDKNTPDPPGGKIDRDNEGNPTGILRENARNLVAHIMPERTEDDIAESLVDLGELLNSQGIIAVGDMGALEPIDYYEVYIQASLKGFKQQVAMYYMWDLFDENKNLNFSKEKVNKESQIRCAGLKLIADGSVSGMTAWMDKPYKDTEEYGVSVCTDGQLESAIEFCKKNKCQLSIHAMGANAIERIVNRVCDEVNWMEDNTPFIRMEHVADPKVISIEKAKEKGIAFVTQPIFLYAEIESYINNLGTQWLKKTYPIKTLIDRGIDVCFSTDAPATSWAVPSNPFVTLKAAITRIAYDGSDCGEDERIDIETAIKLYTNKSAQIAGFEKIGKVEPGYKASFIVLDKDVLYVSNEDIDQIKVVKTFINGELVFEREEV